MRAMASKPKILVADKPVSALAVTVQAKILTLLQELQQKLGFAILLVTHDLRVAAHVRDRISVIYRGRKIRYRPVR